MQEGRRRSRKVITNFTDDSSLAGEPFDLRLGVVSEIEDESEAQAGGFKIIEHLGLLFGGDGLHRLQFEANLAVADEVRFVSLLERLAFPGELGFLLGDKGNATQTQLFLQALLINGLQKPAAHLPADLKDSALNGIDLFFEKQLFVWFVCFVVHKVLAASARQDSI